MTRLLVFGLLLLGVVTSWAQSTDEQYVRIYNLMQQGVALEASGQSESALAKYLEANTELKQLKRVYPAWNPKVVDYRLRFLAERIEAIPAGIPPAPTPPRAVITPPSVATMTSAGESTPVAPATTNAGQVELAELQESLRRLQSEKTILESKLREALATQPAAIDPRELTKAQDRIQTLLKENELLKAGLEEEKKRTAVVGGAQELAATKQALAEANSKLNERTAEKMALEQRVATLTTTAMAAEALRAENELLKKQLAESKTVAVAPPEAGVNPQLAAAEARIASLQSDLDVVRLERIALESRLKRALSQQAKSGTVSRDEDLRRIRQLEQERDEYRRRLVEAGQNVSGDTSREYATRVEQLTREVASLKARVEVFEARAIPYSAEELALFRQVAPKPAAVPDEKTETGRKTISELPTGTVTLVAQAERAFAAKDYAKAEENYLAILRQDERNAYTHANLGAIKLEQGKLDEAERHIQQALSLSPDDAFAVSLLGYLQFRQEKYDDAIVSLNRAAKLNPQNADVQNYLGVTLSHKGLRGPAEQAFRRAVVLNPAHAGAQNNLAVFYASEEPPNVPLARFHYQRALANGHLRNADLERLFEKKEPVTK
jgi:tetratricopeptide (TPR) repeat protein